MKNAKKTIVLVTFFITIFLASNISNVMSFSFEPEPPPDDPPPTPPPPADTTNPSIIITSPGNGAILYETTTIKATATDNVGILQVTFSMDGNQLGYDTSSPYEVTFNAINYDEGYHTITALAIDTSYNTKSSSITVQIKRPFALEVERNDFTYTDDYFKQLWLLDLCNWDTVNYNYHARSCDDGIVEISEVSGKAGSSAYVSGALDLSSWTGIGDLNLEIKVRVQSSYCGSSSVTQLRLGIVTWGESPVTKWSYYEKFTYTKDTGWIVKQITIPEENLISYGGYYRFYWGFYDSWSHDWNQKVSIDYLKVTGDAYPEATLIRAQEAVTTKPQVNAFMIEPEFDHDRVDIGYSTKVSGIDTLGFGYVDEPLIESAIQIVLDPDEDKNAAHYRYNLVDFVMITIQIENVISGNLYEPRLEGVWTNEVNEVEGDMAELDTFWDVVGLIGTYVAAAAGIICLIPGGQIAAPVAAVGGIVSGLAALGGAITDYATKEYETYTLTTVYDPTAKKTYVKIDFNEPKLGSTDLKLKLAVRPIFDFINNRNTYYRVKIDYDVGLKHVQHRINKETDFAPISYSECFDYITYDTTQDNVRIVDKNSCTFLDGTLMDFYFNAPVSLSGDPGDYVLETVNGPQWYLVVGSSGNSVYLDAPDQFTYSILFVDHLFQFEKIEMRYWQPTVLQLNPISYASNQINRILEINVLFYQFRIEYNQIT